MNPQMSFFINQWRDLTAGQRSEDFPSRRDLEGTWNALLSSVEWVGHTEAYIETQRMLEEVMGQSQLNWLHTLSSYP